jgi:hypothetical protein
MASAMRILATRMEEAVSATGYERAAESIWTEVTPPSKQNLN